MPLTPITTVTASKSVHRAGSLNSNLQRFVQGELPLPVFEANGDNPSVNWSDGGKGGQFMFVSDLHSVIYKPANRTQIITITATDDEDNSASATLTVFGTFPLYPQKGYEIEEDEETKTKLARDGTPYFSEQFKPQITWKLGMDRRLADEMNEVFDFLVFHRKVKLFWVYDQERKLMNKVRRVSPLPTKFESANSWSVSVIVKGDYAPTVILESGLSQLWVNAGGTAYQNFIADNFYANGAIWYFSGVIDDSGLTIAPGGDVLNSLRYDPTAINYTFEGLLPDTAYSVTLYFYANDGSERTMHINYNSGDVENDITYAASGTPEELTDSVTADEDGVIDLVITNTSGVNAIINAIRITKV